MLCDRIRKGNVGGAGIIDVSYLPADSAGKKAPKKAIKTKRHEHLAQAVSFSSSCVGLLHGIKDQWAICSRHRKFLIMMTSLLSLPRVSASCLPSRDQSKSKIRPDSNFVTCFGAPPAKFCSQMLETPFRVRT
jgi:hypothetical protein